MNIHRLFICNDDKSELFIADVSISPQFQDIPSKVIVSGYTREDIRKLPNCSITSCSMTQASQESSSNQKPLQGFAKYLFDRKKSAIILLSLDQTKTLYLMPPENSSENFIRCLYCVKSIPKLQPQQVPDQSKKLASQGNTADTGLLSSLLSTVQSSAAMTRTEAERNAMKMKENPMVTLERQVRNKLTAFLSAFKKDSISTNGNTNNTTPVPCQPVTVLKFDPMTKEERFIVHDVVTSQFDNQLVSMSVGEDDDRHIEVHIKGFEPIEEEEDPLAALRQDSVRGNTRRKATTTTTAASSTISKIPPPANVDTSLTKLNINKRDRRTMEQVQQDIKRRKTEESETT